MRQTWKHRLNDMAGRGLEHHFTGVPRGTNTNKQPPARQNPFQLACGNMKLWWSEPANNGGEARTSAG